MTGLKDVYNSRKESNLGKTGQIRMEIKAVNKSEQNAQVFYHATNPTLQTRQSSGFREDNEDVAGYDGEVQQQVGGFSVKKMITGRIVSKCNSNECKVNDQVNENNQ